MAETKCSPKTVNVEEPHQFVLRSVKTKGLRPNTFNGKRTKGFQISIQVPDDGIKKSGIPTNPKTRHHFLDTTTRTTC